MTAAIPTLGFPSRKAAIAALHAQGLQHCEIGNRLRGAGHFVTDSSISATLRACGLISHNPSRLRTGKSRSGQKTIVFEKRILRRLEADADARGISVNALVRWLIDTIAEDGGLVNAVLDDVAEQVETYRPCLQTSAGMERGFNPLGITEAEAAE